MKKIASSILSIALVMVLSLTACAMTQEEAQKAAEAVVNTTTDPALVTSPFINVIKGVQSSVVGINNYQTYTYNNYNPYYGFGGFGPFGGFGNDNDRGQRESAEQLAATGSGVVVYEGLVLTNYHVVEDATRLTVSTLVSDEEYEAVLVNYDQSADLALIHVPSLELPAVPLGDSDQLQVGEWAICIGNPLMEELRGTVTAGIVSAIDRQIDSTPTTDKYGLKRTVTNSMIQIDAAINSGNSGGGMFNVLGQLMGIPSQKYSGSQFSGASIEGIGLCIPINAAKSLISEAIVSVAMGEYADIAEGETKGSASISSDSSRAKSGKPTLGITVHAITNTNDYFVYEGALPGGIMIDEVRENSPAEKAGLQPYDIIVEVDGQISSSTAVITQALNSHKIGDILKVKIYRVENYEEAKSISDLGKGEYIDIDVELFEFDVNT